MNGVATIFLGIYEESTTTLFVFVEYSIYLHQSSFGL